VQVTLANVVFARRGGGGNGVGRHLSHREKLDVPLRAIGGDLGGVDPDDAARRPTIDHRRGSHRRNAWTKRVSMAIGAIGDARFHPSAGNGRLVFWHSLPVPRTPLRPSSFDHSYPHSPFAILHSC